MNRGCLFCAAFVAICLLLTGLSWIHSTHCTSVDSSYYLQSAANILTGRGYVVNANGQLVWNSTFPMGYPFLIVMIAGLFGIPVLVASKLVNLIALCFFAWVWARRLGISRAFWLLSIWVLGGFLKIAAFTWSETVFLVLLAEWVWALHRLLNVSSLRWAARLMALSLSLFLVRYVGGFVFGLLLLLVLLRQIFPNLFQKRYVESHQGLFTSWGTDIALAGFVLMGVYFWINHHFSGTFSGGERFLPTESPGELALLFGRSLLNEFLLIRDFSPSAPNVLAWIGLGLQTILMGVFYRRHRFLLPRSVMLLRSHLLSNLFILTGITYVVVLFTLRTISPFSEPNLRLMAPFSFCLFSAFFLNVGRWPVYWQRRLLPYWLVLLLLSWLQLLPQNNLSSVILYRKLLNSTVDSSVWR
ncbi:hypothetical protein IC229_07040 [Spirosoma sp. BT702]|uniref:DUF2029 domain-containing protein n=1 Tax=Spirosoma profusum TaxID=2771354 RepID=A0A926XYF9_9BACT|nr:hypothetical protein [Spirosoma profusum]MBD2700382.1 hypothetical protein [Spirosoma profusum]